MKTNLPAGPFSFRRQGFRSGSALLIALGCVALLTLLVVAFLIAARTDYSTSTFYSRGVNTKLLSETALNTVMAQISQATKSNDALSGSPVAWASQPGMIRTYGMDGSATSYYKLYSWDNMATGTFNQTDPNETAPASWDLQKGIYTDLNEPVQTSSNGAVYPIIDGNNLAGGVTDIYGNPVPGKSYSNSAVEGFHVNPPPNAPSAGYDNQDVAMPVKWIYVLQDGTTCVAQPAAGNASPTAASVPLATASNKIVGRIAFWTDDETSKVNINTASEGNFWDIPLADGWGERVFGANPPVQGEYQRMPGNPATVSLSAVFGAPGEFRPSNLPSFFLTSDFANVPDATTLNDLFSLTPRLFFSLPTASGNPGTPDTSEFGTRPNLITPESPGGPAYVAYGKGYTPALTLTPAPKANRLYSTIDELLFDASSAPKPPRPATNALITPAALEQAKFFITANSRAPEVTLFNTPRISMWPITWQYNVVTHAALPTLNTPTPPPITSNNYYSNTASNTLPMLKPEEMLLAFCGTVGGPATGPYQYYFQRQNAYDPNWDYTQITRNRQLISYLDTLTSQPVPGFGGGTFLSKYGNDQAQIITEMFDYIRSGPNLNNVVAQAPGGAGPGANGVQVNYDYAPIGSRNLVFSLGGVGGGNNVNGGSSVVGGGTVVPITIQHSAAGPNTGPVTSGAGRFVTITEAALVFYAAARQEAYDTTLPATQPTHFINYPTGPYHLASTYPQTETGAQTTTLGMYLLLNIYDPTPGYIANEPYFIVRITGPAFSINGNSINFPASTILTNQNGTQALFDGTGNTNATSAVSGRHSSPDAFMGCPWTLALSSMFANGMGMSFGAGGATTSAGVTTYGGYTGSAAYDPRVYPFWAQISSPTILPAQTTFSFTGTPVTLQIFPVNSNRNNNSSLTTALNLQTFAPIATPSQTITIDFSKLNNPAYPMPIAPEFNKEELAGDGTESIANVPAADGVVPKWDQYDATDYYYSTTNTNPIPSGDPVTGGIPAAPFGGPTTANHYLGSFDMRNLFARALVNIRGPGIPSEGRLPGFFNTNFNGIVADTQTTGFLDTAGNTLMPEMYNTSYPLCADTVISMRLDSSNPTTTPNSPNGDARLLALTQNVGQSGTPSANWFVPHYAVPSVQVSATDIANGNVFPRKGAHSLYLGAVNPGYSSSESAFGFPAASGNFWANNLGAHTAWVGVNTKTSPGSAIIGDFNNGYGFLLDGAVIPKPDDTTATLSLDGNGADTDTPYFNYYNGLDSAAPYFSPARQISGPVAFGVLPSGVKAGVPWRQLAFNPNPEIGAAHIGLQSPPDHLLLDLFWMPAVEPYAISEPLSTAGKINLNYQIEPFTYINRQTALYAAMKSDKILAIPATASDVYKYEDVSSGGADYTGGTTHTNQWGFRFPIDIFETLKFFDYRLNPPGGVTGKLFISPSEICSMFLYPKSNPVYRIYPAAFALPAPDPEGPTNPSMTAWWAAGNPNTALTGANGRQQPYAHLYSLLTTKSNTFQVHMRVQVLAKSKTTDPTIFDENGGDAVVGEYRGSAIIERYVDANDPTLPDFATTFTTAGQNTLDPYYHFRIVSTKAFTPK